MAIFSRRVLQQLIDDNARFLRRRHVKKHVDMLNKGGESSLPFEWEVVVLNAFSRFGTVRHEPSLGGARTPDIHFICVGDPNQTFIADIATVSDQGLDEKNPAEALFYEVLRLVAERGLRANAISVKVEPDTDDESDEEVRSLLKLPGRGRFKEIIFNDEFSRFLDEISQESDKFRDFRIKNESADLLITYNPAQGVAMLTNPGYSLATSLTKNTVYRCLEEKAQQLSQSGAMQQPRGIILCDGGNSLLRRGREWGACNIVKIIHHFLSQYPSVSFVLTLFVKQTFGGESRAKVIFALYKGKSFASLGDDVLAIINNLGNVIPEPERSARNAISHLSSSRAHEGSSFWGGLTVSDDNIKISARALLEMLAGRITQEEFFRAHHFISKQDGSASLWNPFDIKLDRGQLLTQIDVEKTDAVRDDDWLVVRFGPPDAAVSRFRVPPPDTPSERARANSKSNKEGEK